MLPRRGHGCDATLSRDRAVGINHELLGNTLVEVRVALRRLVERDHRDIAPRLEVDLVVQDGVHQLAMVLHDRALASTKAERLGPAETDAGRNVTRLGSLVDSTRVAGHVESRDTNGATGLGDLHTVIEYLRRLLHVVASAAASAGLKAYGIDGTVNNGFAEDPGDLVGYRGVNADIHHLTAERSSLIKALFVVVAHNHNGGPKELGSSGSCQPDRTGTSNVDCLARLNTGLDAPVVSRREDIGQKRERLDLLHRLIAVRELEQVPVGIRHHDVLRLPANPATHVDVAVRGARAGWVDVEANTSVSSLAELAPPARNIERH
mmetsp:Transcript_16757/g.43508  ORF Transcript_16757/g.43508 Transcript_16757/m.43508 type:complete len:321 (+) Transcript_16757:119-1081(+)